jgi:hypothetical protein
MYSVAAPVNNLPSNDGGLVKFRRARNGYSTDSRFHFKISKKLYDDFKRAARRSGYTLSQMINKVMHDMAPLLDEYDAMVAPDLPFEDCAVLDHDVWLEMQPWLFRKLEYLHYRFHTFSIATVLRRILRFYVVRCGGCVDLFLRKLSRMVREVRRFGLRKRFPLFTPHTEAYLSYDRILLMDKYNEIHAIHRRYEKSPYDFIKKLKKPPK